MSKIAVLDFGGQYAHLIATRIRRLGAYSEILPPSASPADHPGLAGVIFSGGPSSVYAEDRPRFDPAWLSAGIPVLGLCYGHHLIAQTLGGEVVRGRVHEFGSAALTHNGRSGLFAGIPATSAMWMSHGDEVVRLPEGFEVVATTDACSNAAIEDKKRKIFGVQFHPEVTHSQHGEKLLANFLDVVGVSRDWNMGNYLETALDAVRRRAEGKKVFLLVSGGVDSTVAFALLNKALGPDRVLGLHIDNGLMRHRESEAVMEYMRREGFDNLRVVDATAEFLGALDGVAEPERKRKIIGDTFLEVKDRETERLGLDAEHWLLAQGTIYPDTIESGGTQHAAVIKTHHNRVPAVLELIRKGLIIEPLAELYKDEVRALGEELGIPHELVWRHPFPGPGLGVRLLCQDGTIPEVAAEALISVEHLSKPEGFEAIALPVRSVGVQGDGRTYAQPVCLDGPCDWERLEKLGTEIPNHQRAFNRVVWRVAGKGYFETRPAFTTPERLELLRKLDDAATTWMRENGFYDKVWQMPVVLLPVLCGGKEVVVLRPVISNEAMTAMFWKAPEAALRGFAERALALGAGAVLYDVTHKPPGTIEWE